MIAFTAAVFLALSLHTVNGGTSSTGGAGWEYDGPLGPDKWHTKFPNCGGRMQSPIDIDTSDILYDPNLRPFDLRQYSLCTGCTMRLENVDGHTAEVIYGGSPITISGGSLPDEYILDQFHFHWGGTNNVGSEHLLNNVAAPLEMHIVHHMKKYNKTESASNPYGLAVLGFFFKIGDNNSDFDHLLSYFGNITHKNEHVEMEPFALSDLLPEDAEGYYRYYGSLTTPPCYETVIWTLFTQKIEISQQQLDTFRSLKTVRPGDSVEVAIVNDYRPVQDLHERSVTSNDKTVRSDVASEMVVQLRAQMDELMKTCNGSPARAGTSLFGVAVMLWIGLKMAD